MWKRNYKNHKGFRTVSESILYPEIEVALNDWKSNCNSNYVLIGGLAFSFYLKPRPTQDIDLIFLSSEDIPDHVFGFKRTRKHAFTHIKTHVEVEVLTPTHINSSTKRFQKVFDTAIESEGVKIASPLSLIVLKLSRYNERDRADISELIRYCKENNLSLDDTDYDLNLVEISRFEESIKSVNESVHYDNHHELECRYIFNESKTEKIKVNSSEFPYDVYVVCDKYSETPFFYFGKNVGSRIRKFEDFNYSITIPNKENQNLEVIGSSTDYKSFNGHDRDITLLNEWLYINSGQNLSKLIESWNKLNPGREI